MREDLFLDLGLLMKYVNDNGDDSPSGCFGTIEYEFDNGAGLISKSHAQIQ